MASDLDTLIEMGFDAERAALAVKHSSGLQGAMDWLEKHQDRDLAAIQQDLAEDAEAPALQPGETARSLVCNECGKRFRSQAQAEFHATKSEHTDFSESTEALAPLTPAERDAKLEELRARAAERRAAQAVTDKAEQKRNEEIRRKSTKETQDLKEDLAKKQQLKEAAAKKREQADEAAAKQRIRERIEADKRARKEKAERERAAREGRAAVVDDTPPPSAPTTTATKPKAASAYTETRLRLQTPSGTLTHAFGVDTTLFEVAHHVREANGFAATQFLVTFPRKAYAAEDFGLTLREAGLVPSAALQLS